MKYISPNCIRSESGLGAHTSARLAIRFLYAAGHPASTYIQSLRVVVRRECRTGVCFFYFFFTAGSQAKFSSINFIAPHVIISEFIIIFGSRYLVPNFYSAVQGIRKSKLGV